MFKTKLLARRSSAAGISTLRRRPCRHHHSRLARRPGGDGAPQGGRQVQRDRRQGEQQQGEPPLFQPRQLLRQDAGRRGRRVEGIRRHADRDLQRRQVRAVHDADRRPRHRRRHEDVPAERHRLAEPSTATSTASRPTSACTSSTTAPTSSTNCCQRRRLEGEVRRDLQGQARQGDGAQEAGRLDLG